MRFSKISLSVFAVFASLSAWGTITCSNPSDTVSYEQWSKEGGAAPRPDDPMRTTTVKYTYVDKDQGKTIQVKLWEEIVKYRGKTEVDEKSLAKDLVIKLDEKKTIYASNEKTKAATGVSVYKTKMTLTRTGGDALFPDRADKTFTDYLICVDSWNFLMPKAPMR